MQSLDLPELENALEDVEFFERERTDTFVVELAIVLYNSGVSLRKIKRVLGWIGAECSHVAVWNWIQKFGERLSATGSRPVAELPSTILLDETAVVQHGEQFVLFAALDPATREVVHLGVSPSRNYLTTRRFLEEIEELYGELPEVVITDGARGYYPSPRSRLRLQEPYRTLDTGTQTPDRHVLRLVHRRYRRTHPQLAPAVHMVLEPLPILTLPQCPPEEIYTLLTNPPYPNGINRPRLESDSIGYSHIGRCYARCYHSVVKETTPESNGRVPMSQRLAQELRGFVALLPGLGLLVLIGVVAMLASKVIPVNDLIISIVIGIAYANLSGVNERLEPGTGEHKLLLETGIVVMGARLALSQVVRAGPMILLLVVLVIAFVITFVELVSSQIFHLDDKLGTLVASGSSICGVSAIVAVAGSVKAREEQIAYAVATILLFDAITLFAYPTIGTLLHLPNKVYGIWAGLSMFSTGPVAAAGFAYSDVAGQWATLTKLIRNIFIGFVAIAYSVYYTKRGVENEGSASLQYLWDRFPKFIFGFVLFMMLASIGFFTANQVATFKKIYSWLFVFAFAGLGLNIRMADLRKAGGKPVVLVLLTLLIVSPLSLLIVYTLFG